MDIEVFGLYARIYDEELGYLGGQHDYPHKQFDLSDFV